MSAATIELPRKGEVWRWAWLTAYIEKAGPKRVTYRVDTRLGQETLSVSTKDFLRRFHKTNLGSM